MPDTALHERPTRVYPRKPVTERRPEPHEALEWFHAALQNEHAGGVTGVEYDERNRNLYLTFNVRDNHDRADRLLERFREKLDALSHHPIERGRSTHGKVFIEVKAEASRPSA